ncbi:ERF family protein [Leuconostoc falkenbergense]|uniref:ERF family protein n=1 Tax=Leuconostoc falkenbergense TaxID=2766470 RepID=UPI0021AAC1CF|nr:ERF family protein [Leuconostoc falkenbergense]
MTEFKTLYEALAETQNNIEQPKKEASNPMFKSNYVTLDAVINSIVKARKAAGAKFFFTNIVNDGLMITRVIGYGETLDLTGSKVANDLGNRGTNSAQAEGSALTYARRYSLSMAFGIASDVDDDGNAANNEQHVQTNTTGGKPKDALNSEFGKLSKQIQTKRNIDEVAFFQGLSGSVGLNLKQFMDFAKLSQTQKQMIVETLRGWVGDK